MADMSQDDLDSIFGGEEGAEPPPAEVSSEESVEKCVSVHTVSKL